MKNVVVFGDTKIKVLIVNTSDAFGGAHIAANRIHQSLLLNNIDSKMLVKHKQTYSSLILEVPQNRILRLINVFLNKLENYFLKFYKNKSQTKYSTEFFSLSNVIEQIEKINPDIVHLNWMSNGFIKIEDICRIKKPIVWTLHDMFAFTGGCHYNNECSRFINKCGNCKVLGTKNEFDISRFNYIRKKRFTKKLKK